MTVSHQTAPQAPDTIRYTLRFPAPQTHYVEVEAVYPTGGQPHIDLFMAVWTPGSYLVREYERHMENVAVRNGADRTRAAEKTAKNRWRVESAGAPAVTVTYRVYGREMTVRTNWIETGFAMLNGAPTFLSLVGGARRHEVRIELPTGWTGSATALTPLAGQPNAYVAEDFDTLVDSPILVGNPVIREFYVGGTPHSTKFIPRRCGSRRALPTTTPACSSNAPACRRAMNSSTMCPARSRPFRLRQGGA